MMTQGEVFAELQKRGVSRVLVDYSGGGDEGGVDDIRLFDLAGKEMGRMCDTHKETLDDHLARALGAPVYEQYGSFAGEFSCAGTVEWNVKAGTVEHNEDYYRSLYDEGGYGYSDEGGFGYSDE